MQTKEYRQAYYTRNKERIKAAWQENRVENLERKRWNTIRNNYGLTREQYTELLTSQGNRCAVCAQPFPSRRKTHVDHQHTTGGVRGLLCHHCNVALGSMADSPERLRAAASYLRSAL